LIGIWTQTGTTLSRFCAGVNFMISATANAASSSCGCPDVATRRVSFTFPVSSMKNQTLTVPPMPASLRRGGYSRTSARCTSSRFVTSGGTV
jgi:hypothetical protein